MSRIFENTQKKLDALKWDKSKMHEEDLSGKMWYCIDCKRSSFTQTCNAPQKERETNFLCAKAYIRAVKKNGRIKNVQT